MWKHWKIFFCHYWIYNGSLLFVMTSWNFIFYRILSSLDENSTFFDIIFVSAWNKMAIRNYTSSSRDLLCRRGSNLEIYCGLCHEENCLMFLYTVIIYSRIFREERYLHFFAICCTVWKHLAIRIKWMMYFENEALKRTGLS